MAADYLPIFTGQITASDVHLQLTGIESQLGASVWFVDRNGEVISSAQSETYPLSPAVIEDFDPAEGGGSQYQIGTYHDMFKEDVITVVAPVVYGYSPNGYLLIHKYVSDLEDVQKILMQAAT